MAAGRSIWITRAQPGADATAARLRDLGHEPVIAPLLSVRDLSPIIDLDGVGALAFSSANGVRAFAKLSPERGLRAFAVGAATAEAAKAAGFTGVLSADGDVDALAAAIAARGREIGGIVLHAAAAQPAGDLVGALGAAGVSALAVAVYETVVEKPGKTLLDALGDIDLVLVHSPRAAKALAPILGRQPAPRLRALCISRAAAAPLKAPQAKGKLGGVAFAPFPIETALLNLIDRQPD
ncbi:uroporphyrinogen-III synthase [Caulobacter segnis]|uniref:uroporphyrinogen-III synthase n=1 Tax=Caulobacter segnis TaxID=88688 RepID=UPI00240EF5A0|nr:uroporphyrinogen-III synthase [Caulobacter segnis]MDG2521194.1 uroporphyrinogen-III synthase [Caulobacter segnis]